MFGKLAFVLFVATGGQSTPDHAIEAWFAEVGTAQDQEIFGELLARAARVKLGVPYDDAPQTAGPEALRVNIDQLHCVSLIEYADAIARCTWADERNRSCFVREVETTRYRDGKRVDYGSRLHYFTEWLLDNERRARLESLVSDQPSLREPFFFMTAHPKSYPALQHPAARRAIQEVEQRLSATEIHYVARDRVRSFQRHLKSGDLVALLTEKPGLLVAHTGIVSVDKQGRPRLLHASMRNRRVVLSRGDLADYVLRRPERRGIIVSRPLPPRSLERNE